MFEQFAHAGEGGQADDAAVQALPDLIEGGEPVEQLHVLDLGQVPGKDLVEVMVGVHKAGIAPAVAGIKDGIGCLGKAGADGTDEAVFAVEVYAMEDLVGAVTGDEGLDIFQQQSGHGKRSFLPPSIGEQMGKVNCLSFC